MFVAGSLVLAGSAGGIDPSLGLLPSGGRSNLCGSPGDLDLASKNQVASRSECHALSKVGGYLKFEMFNHGDPQI